jgi:hypothetical protein
MEEYIKRWNNTNGDFAKGTEHLNPVIVDYFSLIFSSKINATDPKFLEKIASNATLEVNEKPNVP